MSRRRARAAGGGSQRHALHRPPDGPHWLCAQGGRQLCQDKGDWTRTASRHARPLIHFSFRFASETHTCVLALFSKKNTSCVCISCGEFDAGSTYLSLVPNPFPEKGLGTRLHLPVLLNLASDVIMLCLARTYSAEGLRLLHLSHILPSISPCCCRLLLRRFRVPQENAVTFQRGLVEREINELLQGVLVKSAPLKATSSSENTQKTAPRKEILSDDVCPICQEELQTSKARLTYCQLSCGQSMHLKCMKIWAEHQKSRGERAIKCPLCREDFGELVAVRVPSSRTVPAAEQQTLHLGVACSNCHVCPIAGKCYKCTVCISYHLCYACFSSNQVHLLHSFQFRQVSSSTIKLHVPVHVTCRFDNLTLCVCVCVQHMGQKWRGVARVEGRRVPASDAPRLPPALVQSLQSRALTHSDCRLLQQLDGPVGPVPARVLNSFPLKLLESGHQLLASGAMCEVCRQPYRRGDWVRRLPCRHKVSTHYNYGQAVIHVHVCREIASKMSVQCARSSIGDDLAEICAILLLVRCSFFF